MSDDIPRKTADQKTSMIRDFIANTFLDVGFMFALGNAILIPGPVTLYAAMMIYGMKVAGHVGTKTLPEERKLTSGFARGVRKIAQILNDSDTSLLVAGVALAPVAFLAFQAVPAGLSIAGLLSNSAFLGGVTASLFSVFDISKALQNKGKLPRMKHKNIGRVINTVTDPENIATVGLMFTAAMAGPVGWLLAPVIGMGGVISTINAQKPQYSNSGRPKLWFAAACTLSASAALASGQVQALGAVIANYVFAASYIRLETYEPDDFIGSVQRRLKKIIPSRDKKTATIKGPQNELSHKNTLTVKRDNTESRVALVAQSPKKREALRGIFAKFGRPKNTSKKPIKVSANKPKNP